jgi:maltose alpha-D-glucosyltransferase/alpha-amylase
MSAHDPLWYKDAVVYELHVKAYFDSNEDGIGDFQGLTRKLDYLQDLGVTALWLLPFYPSPLRDDGYDIADYLAVNPTFGAMADFRAFVREAHRRGLKVITELVINHTSDQHPWFQRARRARPESAAREFYVWSDTDQKYLDTRVIFTDAESSNWSWDPIAQAHYWHRFFSHQPDLNFDNPAVVKAVTKVMDFWLDCGVDGLRLDAIPYLVEREGTSNENLPETHAVIRELRAWLDRSYGGRVFLAEANQWPEDVRPYFGDGDECHMAFHFPLMPRIYMALAREDRHPITDILRQTPEIPESCQWVIFLRNHDELTLEMVTDRERDYLWQFYAADRQARINLGIRRRLAPLLENDRRKIELLNCLLMSMPGTPVIYYGDEIGMGDNIYLGDRNGVRTPMQWSPDRNGGFSRADPARLYLPPIMDAVYGFQAVNVEAQQRSPSSLLNWMRRLIGLRRAHAAFGRGDLVFLYPANRKVLAYLRRHGGETILCIANLSRAPQPVALDLPGIAGRVPVEMMAGTPFPPVGDGAYILTLPPYGFLSFLLRAPADAPDWREPRGALRRELATLVLPRGWASLVEGETRRVFERQVLPDFLSQQRWFGGQIGTIDGVSIADQAEIADGEARWLLSVVDVAVDGAARSRCFLPLAIVSDGSAEDPVGITEPHVIARTRRGAKIGMLADATVDAGFARTVVAMIRNSGEAMLASGGRIRFHPAEALAQRPIPLETAVQRSGGDQSNSSIIIDDQMVLKLYRRLEPGVNPEIEATRHLSEVAGYASSPALLGWIEAVDADGASTALAALLAHVPNQGDGWTFTLDYLKRSLDEAAVLTAEAIAEADRHHIYATLATTLGRRVAGLHSALARHGGDPAFRPEPIGPDDIVRWREEGGVQAAHARKALQAARPRLDGEAAVEADALILRWGEIEDRLARLLPATATLWKGRIHGDLHLGQTLLSKDDFAIVDFEGEPTAPLARRRAKDTVLKDVAGMLRSFDYAAAAVLEDRLSLRPGARDQLAPRAEAWRHIAGEAFLRGYRAALGDAPYLPENDTVETGILTFFRLRRALYEIAYEAENRPNFLAVPVRGVRDILGG